MASLLLTINGKEKLSSSLEQKRRYIIVIIKTTN